ncbi:MAG TPA: Crp/Fnr family transcriptional regulator [Cyclobacteriaceae bacterium]|jgi:CRP-like cAMP-binding protein|nr:Crp/Fnr family transcriptional regulator [Cyclobacteriaceae bacterium]
MFDPILKNISRHIHLTDEEIKRFTSALKVKNLRKRQYLLQAGDVCRFENFVSKGLLRAYTIDDKGAEHILMLASEDWWISDLFSFLSDTPSAMHIDALEDSEIISIEKPDLEKLYIEIPKLERLMRLFISEGIRGSTTTHSGFNQSVCRRAVHFVC